MPRGRVGELGQSHRLLADDGYDDGTPALGHAATDSHAIARAELLGRDAVNRLDGHGAPAGVGHEESRPHAAYTPHHAPETLGERGRRVEVALHTGKDGVRLGRRRTTQVPPSGPPRDASRREGIGAHELPKV